MAKIVSWSTGEVIYEGPGAVEETLTAGVKDGVSFVYASLAGMDLSKTKLCFAKLRGADLRFAKLRDAKLRGADLCYADLRGANLAGAYLAFADLRFADLSSAYLGGANLTDANLPDNVPVLVGIHQFVYAAASKPGALDMSRQRFDWAGHIVALAGEAGRQLEEQLGTDAAAALIWGSSDRLGEPVPNWYSSNEKALSEMKRLAELEAALNTGAGV